jgi:hypothetical protein
VLATIVVQVKNSVNNITVLSKMHGHMKNRTHSHHTLRPPPCACKRRAALMRHVRWASPWAPRHAHPPWVGYGAPDREFDNRTQCMAIHINRTQQVRTPTQNPPHAQQLPSGAEGQRRRELCIVISSKQPFDLAHPWHCRSTGLNVRRNPAGLGQRINRAVAPTTVRAPEVVKKVAKAVLAQFYTGNCGHLQMLAMGGVAVNLRN